MIPVFTEVDAMWPFGGARGWRWEVSHEGATYSGWGDTRAAAEEQAKSCCAEIADDWQPVEYTLRNQLAAATARAEAAEQRAEALGRTVERMFAAVRKITDRCVRDAENARKRRLDWRESAGCEAEVAKSMLRALEQAAKAEAQPAGEVSDG